jgi:hypothetical protein
MPSEAYRRIREAILRRQQVLATYHGLPRSFCPHAIGFKQGVAHCLAYQFAGQSRSRVIVPHSPDNWRCVLVDALHDVRVREGPWYTAYNFVEPSSCIDEIDVAVVSWPHTDA